jgi:hypothetical protein
VTLWWPERGAPDQTCQQVERSRQIETAACPNGAGSLDLGDTIEAVHALQIRRQKRIDQLQGETAREQPNPLLTVRIEDVIDTFVPFDGAGLAACHRAAGEALELDRHMLGDMAEPGPVPQAADQASGLVIGTAMPAKTRQQR